MFDIKKVVKYCILISKQKAAGMNVPEDALLDLLKKYIKQNTKDARTYKRYLKLKIAELKSLSINNQPLSHYLAALDDDISNLKNRQANKITKQHDPLGDFNALLVAFIVNYPGVIEGVVNNRSEHSIIKNCYQSARQHRRQNKRAGGDAALFGRDIWQHTCQFLSGQDIVNYSKTGRHAYRLLEGPRKLSKLRYVLLKAVENQDHELVRKLVQLNPRSITDPIFVREKSVFFIASWNQDEKMFWILAKPYTQKNANVKNFLKFHYLVMGGQRIKAERFIAGFPFATRKKFILSPGPHGFSVMQVTEIELKDIPMRTRLLRQLTHDPAWLTSEHVKIYKNYARYSTHREKWLACVDLLQENLDEALKELVTAQIESIEHNSELVKQADNFIALYKDTHQQVINHYKRHQRIKGDKILMTGVGQLMRKLARHMLYEYFRPQRLFYGPNSVITDERLAGCAYEMDSKKLDFQFNDDMDLFGVSGCYSSLGRKMYIHRGEYEALRVYLLCMMPYDIAGRNKLRCRDVLGVITREFELKDQMSEELNKAIQPKKCQTSQKYKS